MRGWTLVLSVVFHLCVITGIVVAPLVATDELPEPRRAAPEYILVTAPLPPDPAPVRPRNAPVPQSPSAAPLTPQNDILPETPATAPVPSPVDFGAPSNDAFTGVVPSSVVSDDPLPLPTPPVRKDPVRVGGEIRPPQKIRDVAPRYPPMALAGGIDGLVILQATIAEDGSVQDVKVLRGKPLLDEAAVEAVRQWRFTPTHLNGVAVPVVMTVTVSFTRH